MGQKHEIYEKLPFFRDRAHNPCNSLRIIYCFNIVFQQIIINILSVCVEA